MAATATVPAVPFPPYSSDRNPDALGEHRKAGTVGRRAITGKDDFKAKIRSSMRQLQNAPEKIRSFHQKPSRIRRVNVTRLMD
ncbi:MAG: hypothetical protein WBG11_07095 [Methylocella sp.]